MKNYKVCYDFVLFSKGYKGLDCEEKYNIFGKYIFKLLALLS